MTTKSFIPKRKDRSKYENLFVAVVILLALALAGLASNVKREQGNITVLLAVGGVLAVAMGGMLAFAYRRQRNWHSLWQGFARQLGLQYGLHRPGQSFGLVEWPRLYGRFRGYEVLVTCFRSGGRYPVTYTALRLKLHRPAGWQLTLSKGRLAGKKGKLGKGKLPRLARISLPGALGRAFYATASSEAQASRALAPPLGKWLTDIAAQSGETLLIVERNEVYYHERDPILDGDYLQAVLTALVTLAQRAEGEPLSARRRQSPAP